ncbi:MAG: hypothetical protein R2749_09600 [Acidimicrobiales bacterium]
MGTAMGTSDTAHDGATGGRYYGWVVAWTAFGVLTVTYGVQFSFGCCCPRSSTTWV